MSEVLLAENDAARLARYARIESALLDVSRLLLSDADVNLREVLGKIGQATGALSGYFTILAPDGDLPRPDAGPQEYAAGRTITWRSHEVQGVLDVLHSITVEDPRHTTVALPVLSARDQLYGHLGFEYEAEERQWAKLDERALDVLGSLLAAYFERKYAEQAREESEERWRRLVERHPEPILVTTGGNVRYVNEAGTGVFGAADYHELVGRKLEDFLPAEDLTRVHVRHEPADPLVQELIRLDGEIRLVEVYSVPITFRGRPSVQTVFRDITERRRAAERHRTFVEAISEGICSFEVTPPVRVEAPFEVQAKALRASRLSESNRVMSRLLGRLTPRQLVGTRLDRLVPGLDGALVEAFLTAGYRLHNWEYSLPTPSGTRHFLLNAVGTVERGQLVSVWGTCIEVTERVQLERRMMEMMEEQQQRLGRDLHDGVGQLLTGVRILSQSLLDRCNETQAPELCALAKRISQYAGDASQRIREIYRGLTPVQLFDESLAVALDELAFNTNELPGITCTFLHDGKADVEEREAKLHLYRIAQEATNNALKHAHPKHVTLSLRLQQGRVVLQIQDDGVGFRPRTAGKKSLGLGSMRYRAQAAGARLSIESKPGEGTIIRCSRVAA